jgi:hypothetical protein
VAASILVAVVGTIWWQYPALADQGARTDVLIVDDGFLSASERPVTYRIHEDGRSLAWAATVHDWCSVPPVLRGAVEREQPTIIVISVGLVGPCGGDPVGQAIAAAGGRTVVVIREPGGDDVAFDPGPVLVDPTPLVGRSSTSTSMPCQWWDSCDASGQVRVRDAKGALTAAGADRVARMLVAQLP